MIEYHRSRRWPSAIRDFPQHKSPAAVLAIDEIGLFFVNDQLIARLDLSHNLDRGDISAIGGYFNGHTGEPEFRNFNVWTMD